MCAFIFQPTSVVLVLVLVTFVCVQDGGRLQASGEAVYADDVPHVSGALHAAYVTSALPHAALLGVDWSPARDVPGALHM
jgi:xanthine dehydrogenase molybdopterin-binding subunit B